MKTILITGANRGLGLEFAKQYSHAGWHVIACCRKPDEATHLQALQKSHAVDILPLDIHDVSHIQHLPTQIKQPQLDILINNAGVMGGEATFGSLDDHTFASTLHVNTVAPVLIAQSLLPLLQKSTHGMIVNISSFLGSIELNTDPAWPFPIYRISKTALNAATKCMANSLQEKNITVISMDPGWVQTDMGGANADLTPIESISKIRQVLDGMTLAQTGSFVRYDGSLLPW